MEASPLVLPTIAGAPAGTGCRAHGFWMNLLLDDDDLVEPAPGGGGADEPVHDDRPSGYTMPSLRIRIPSRRRSSSPIPEQPQRITDIEVGFSGGDDADPVVGS